MRGLRKYLTPFAPDQSGAESVLYELGGIVVILDAGGCAGNICGFDEPRWSKRRSAVFSAGLRDMDAVMGRDKLLVQKICDCVTKIDARFVAIIGTPVPAVIGTDLQAVKRMLEKRVDLPVITVATDGMHLCDRGISLAYQALLKDMDDRGFLAVPGADKRMSDKPSRTIRAASSGECCGRRAGVFGVTPLDLPDSRSGDLIREALQAEGYGKAVLYGSGATLKDYAEAGENAVNIAASADGIAAVKFLHEKFGTPYEIRCPGAEELWRRAEESEAAYEERPVQTAEPDRVLIVHGQVLGNSLREAILRDHPQAQVTVASWFGMDQDIRQPQDMHLKEEDDFTGLVEKTRPDLIIGDRVLLRMIPGYTGKFSHVPEFSVSGKREAGK